MTETIRIDLDTRGVAIVTLARPEKHNAMNAAMIRDLTEAATGLGAEADVRVVVLASDGPTFCAGADLTWMEAQASKDRAGKIAEARALSDMLNAWDAMPKPVIARVQGAAYGGGLGLIAVSDIVIAVQGARFALTETRLGLIPATIGPFVARRLGASFARQVFFSARAFDTEFLHRAGVVAETVPPNGLDDAVALAVADFLDCAPGAVADAKALLRDLTEAPADVATAEALASRWETDEAQEGIAAFFARREPPWRAES